MVEFQQYTPQQAEEEAWGIIGGNGIAKFDRFARPHPVIPGEYEDLPIGTSYTGIVAENPKSYHAQDYDTKGPKFYKSGQAIIEVSIILDTDYRDEENPEDDGRRILRLGYIGKGALKQEMDRLGIKRFGVGTQLTITFTGYKPNKSGRASKLVNITLVPAEWVAGQQQGVDAVMAAAGFREIPTTPQPVQQVPVQMQSVPVQTVVAPPVPAVPVAAPAGMVVAQPGEVVMAQAGMSVTNEHVQMVRLLTGNGIPRQNALEAVRDKFSGDAQFRDALDMLEAALPA